MSCIARGLAEADSVSIIAKIYGLCHGEEKRSLRNVTLKKSVVKYYFSVLHF